MTEAEWLAATDPIDMVKFLKGKVSDRKLRLFACGCCRSIWHLLTEAKGRDAVEVGEHYVDKLVSNQELAKAHRRAQNAWTAINNAQPDAYERSRDAGEAGCILIHAVNAAKSSTDKAAFTGAWSASISAAHAVGHHIATLGAPATYDEPDSYVREEQAGRRKQYAHQRKLLLDIIGNPFRQFTTNPSWLTSTVLALANSIYQEKAFDRMPILADALQDAGCDNEEILNHCRGENVHVRGCWVLDLVLGRQ